VVAEHPFASVAAAAAGLFAGLRHVVRPVAQGGVFGVEAYTHHAPNEFYADLGFRPPVRHPEGVHHLPQRPTATPRGRASRSEVA
jgi:hypothetical protein